jgi:hypothetical protein
MASDTQAALRMKRSGTPAHSASVRIELNVAGHRFFPSHAAADFLIFREPQTVSPSLAQLIISVDGEPHESSIEVLPHSSPATGIPIRTIAR